MGISTEERGNLDQSLKDLELSTDEIGKFTKAFKDPEFLKMFEDYAKEISDPKVKEETDVYLRQVEYEGRVEEVYGKGVQLVMPTASYAVKTTLLTGEKVFINVCTSEKIEVATKRSGKTPEGKTGSYFDIPLSLGTIKKGTDKDEKPCSVFDFVVHPDTVKMGEGNPAIRNLIVETAMDKIETVHPEWKLDRKFKIPKLSYKKTEGCSKPHVLAFRAPGSEGEAVSGHIRPKDGKSGNPFPAPADLIPPAATEKQPTEVSSNAATTAAAANSAASSSQTGGGGGGGAGADAGAGSRSGFSFKKGATALSIKPEAIAETDPCKPGFVHPSGAVTPHWELVHRGEVDLADTWGDAGRNMAAMGLYPKELVVRVHLPNVSSASAVDLDVSRSRLVASVPGKYHLTTSLPFPVKESLGRAKFDKAKQQLEITLPVAVPPQSAAALPFRQPVAGEGQAGAGEVAAAVVGEAGRKLVELLPDATTVQAVGSEEDGAQDKSQGSSVGGSEASSASEAGTEAPPVTSPSLAEAEASAAGGNAAGAGTAASADGSVGAASNGAAAADSGADSSVDTESVARSEIRRMWDELHAKEAPPPAEVAEAGGAAEEDAEDSDADEGDNPEAAASAPSFIAAACFEGAKSGFAFKTGAEGLGYYTDAHRERAKGSKGQTAPKAAPRATPAPPAPAVVLRPRLNKSLAEELD